MVKPFDYFFVYDLLEFDEVEDHSLFVGGAVYLDIQQVGVAVEPLALAFVGGEVVGGVKGKLFYDCHLYLLGSN